MKKEREKMGKKQDDIVTIPPELEGIPDKIMRLLDENEKIVRNHKGDLPLTKKEKEKLQKVVDELVNSIKKIKGSRK
jgi:hypothetical protein